MHNIARLLTDHGPMTMRDVSRELGVDVRLVVGMMAKAKSCGQVYIHSYRRDEDGGRLYPRALWAAGSKPDAARPAPLSRYELNRRHRARKARAVASVWELGKAVDHRRMGAVTV